ncbi:addiction module protein [Zunongwangia sp. F363]|uniref:Addiction module protein n=1 Tax=Autumnicola tepida TaxID=3075595 RepID=A0ABU3C6X6_9FLAO|nr:addiction module protein [Zunongwangia sp. F363]MDT0642098.1 addiction module protein [Zunongwangia sp. F363]
MNINQLKIELLQKIIDCNNTELLMEIQSSFSSFYPEVNEGPQPYSKDPNISALSENQQKELENRYQSFLKGETKTEDWEKVKAEISKKHGF